MEEEKKKKFGFFKFVRLVSILIFILVVLSAGILISAITTDLPILRPITNFLNHDFTPAQTKDLTYEQAVASVLEKASLSGNQKIYLSQEQIEAFLTKSTKNETLEVKIEDSRFFIYTPFGNKNSPIYLISELKVSDSSKISLSSVGIGRFSLPELLTKQVTNVLNEGLTVIKNSNGGLSNTILPFVNTEVQSFSIAGDKLEVELTFKIFK